MELYFYRQLQVDGWKKKGLKIKYLDNVMQKIAERVSFCQYLEAINKDIGSERKKPAWNTSEMCVA